MFSAGTIPFYCKNQGEPMGKSTHNIWGLAFLCLALCFISVRVSAETSLSWDFASPDQVRAWRGEGIETAGSYQGTFQILGKEQFRLISPPNLGIPARDDPYLRIRFLFRSPRYLRVFWQPRSGKPVLVPEVIQPLFDRNFHTFWIPLTDKLEYRDTIEQLGLIFGGRPGWVEIDSIEILPFSLSRYLLDHWSEFMAPRRLHPGAINSLQSPRLFNKSFITWMNKLALIVLLIGVILFYRSAKNNRARIVVRTGLVILALWIVYDLRETYSQFKIVEEIHKTYVKPPPAAKTFPALGDFYRLVQFCREEIPEDAVFRLLPDPYWPFDCRIKYYLYPRHIETEKTRSFYGDNVPRYYIVYNDPQLTFDPDREQIVDGKGRAISNHGKLIARYNLNSFIFLEEKN
jgi:hypothetical protein